MNVFIKAEYTFRVFPENVDFTRYDVFKYEVFTEEELEETLQRVKDLIAETLENKGCELLDVKLSEATELDYMKNNKKPAHYTRYKMRVAERKKRGQL
ncbi:hypothetical protein [Bacillus paralicheniformis]|uniref:hypothetical protein n=1 Tax=Bacillus paralicheniformis TaxID=1648923 RepID=UPI002DB5AE47|nr:hypothetical protein [Bacillus paralicheniformis]MEC1866742.1 hypothetical protein [Bacillus paralicheniformis]